MVKMLQRLIYQIGQDGLEEVELVTQDTSDSNSPTMKLFEDGDGNHSSEANLLVANTDDHMQDTVQVEAGATQESSIVHRSRH